MERLHPVDVVLEVDSESMIELLLINERSHDDQGGSVRTIGDSIKLCVQDFLTRAKANESPR